VARSRAGSTAVAIQSALLITGGLGGAACASASSPSSRCRPLRLSCSFGKRDLLAAFNEEPHKRQQQHKF
jgi:hypothetical protein